MKPVGRVGRGPKPRRVRAEGLFGQNSLRIISGTAPGRRTEVGVADKSIGAAGLDGEPHRNPHAWILPAVSAVAGLLAAILIILAIFFISQGTDPAALLSLGYPGVSIVMFFSSATVFLPAPGLLAVVGAGGVGQFNPLVLGLFAGLGSSVGELTGYLVGLGARNALHPERGRWMRTVEFFMQRWGFLTILGMASIPNPFFDAVGILAGSFGYPARRLWLACLIGNTIKYTAIALLGGSAAGMLGLFGHN
jgi:membrane protein YqaA with SNARE-associated domain